MGYVYIVYGAASAAAAVIISKMLGTVSITLLSLLNLCLSVGLVAFLLIWEREPNYAVMFIVAILWGICDSNWITLTSSKSYCTICSIIDTVAMHCTVKTLAVKTLVVNLVNYSNSPSFFANFHSLHSLAYLFT